jgi:hypothetical protein
MATKTRKQLDKERYLTIYFHYWKLQNNPEYIQFYKSVKEKGYIESVSTYLKFQLGFFGMKKPIEPFKKIDWNAFIHSGIVDPEIIEATKYSSAFTPAVDVGESWEPWKGMPKTLIPVLINVGQFDKKEILYEVSKLIDYHQNERNLKIPKRDAIKKFHLYAEIWDSRKGFPKKTFREIARELERPTRTVESQFKRAYKLLYGKPYESTEHKAVQTSLIQKTTCKDCPQRPQCKIPCSDVLIQLEGLEVSQAHKLDRVYFDKSGKEKSAYEKALDKEAYRKWQEQPD